MKILVTAFDPFNGESINPAQEALALLPDAIGEAEIKKLTVPTVFFESARVVIEAITLYQPDTVLMLGQAGGREGLTVERVAINFADADIRDNKGHQPQDEPIEKTGPTAYFATLPVKKMVSAIREMGLIAQVSNTAGTFVCNHLLYSRPAPHQRPSAALQGRLHPFALFAGAGAETQPGEALYAA